MSGPQRRSLWGRRQQPMERPSHHIIEMEDNLNPSRLRSMSSSGVSSQLIPETPPNQTMFGRQRVSPQRVRRQEPTEQIIEIEQFLNPPKRVTPSRIESQRSQIRTSTRPTHSTSGIDWTWYYNMPQEWQDAHPMASDGSGLLAPPRANAPEVPATDQEIQRLQMRRSQRRQTPIEDRSITHSTRVQFSEDRGTRVQRSIDDIHTPEWYWTMPQWFRDAHPLAEGGGLLSPGRSYAPVVMNTPPNNTTGRYSSQRRQQWF